uniref:SWIM-type domain-containing protein n=1 Tax=Triticum urartu TaxID=4572 RepID=A0A8R7PJV3_TRIUA
MVVYEVIVRDEGLEFECECGQFEHTGMLCCHLLRVMDVLHLEEVPAKHIVMDGPKMYSTLYMQAMDVVCLGDTSAEAFEHM